MSLLIALLVLATLAVSMRAPVRAGMTQHALAGGPTGRIVYEVGQGKRAWLEVARLDGAGRRRLTAPPRSPSDVNDSHPTWSPDGRWVAFIRYRIQKLLRGTLYVVRADGRDLRKIGPSDTDATGGLAAVWSRDGRRVAFAAPGGACFPWKVASVVMYVGDANGAGLRRVSVTPRTATTTYAGPADLSPDGRSLLYVVQRYAEHSCDTVKMIDSVLYRIRIDATMRTKIHGSAVGPAKWSPNGKRIALASGWGNRSCAVFIRAASGNVVRRLVGIPWVDEGCFSAAGIFAWLPTGELVVAEGSDVATYDVETGHRRLIGGTTRQRCGTADLDPPCENRIAAVSSNGQYVAVEELPELPNSGSKIPGRLYVVRSDGSQLWELPYPKARGFSVFLSSGS